MNRSRFLLCIASVTCCCSLAMAQLNATADFGKWEEYPLVKKMGVYMTPLVTKAQLGRDLPKMSEIESRSYRYEVGWGKDVYGFPAVSGTLTSPVCAFDKYDYMFDLVSQSCPSLVISHGYTPKIIQQAGGWQYAPKDYDAWALINKTYAQHWKTRYSNHYIEVWNEPDYPDFFQSSQSEYFRIYQYASKAIRQGDADVKIGGPSGAFNTWHQTLADYVKGQSLPLDFLSGHAYGTYNWQLEQMRAVLRTFGNNQCEMLLTEYLPYTGTSAAGLMGQSDAACNFFNSMLGLEQYTDLSYVHWAQYIDPASPQTGESGGDTMSLIDVNSGRRRGVFNAFRLFSWMPIDRRELVLDSPLKGFASSDDSRVAAAIWNMTGVDKELNFDMTNIPFENGRIEIYHIDKQSNSWYEVANDDILPELCEDINITDGKYTISNVVRNRGVLFVQIINKEEKSSTKYNQPGKLIRTHQWYDTRTNTSAYANFDANTWTARLSLNGEPDGKALLGITAEDLPATVKVKTINSGNLASRNNNSTLNMRVDYQSASGEYTKSVVFYGDLYNAARTSVLPWGTKSAPTQAVKVDDFAEFSFNVKDYAPSDFSGRVMVSFEMEAAGPNAKANFQLFDANDSGVTLSCGPISPIVDNGISLKAIVYGDKSQVTETGFIVALNDEPINSGIKYKSTDTENSYFVAHVPNIGVDKVYQYRAYATLSNGKTVYSSADVFQAPALVPTVETYEPKLNSNFSAVEMTGSIVSTNGNPIISCGFVLCETYKRDPNTTDIRVTASTASNKLNCSYIQLKPNTHYSVRAFATNKGGVGYGKTFKFTTDPSAVDDTQVDKVKTVVAIYSLDGQLLNDYKKGINIVKYSDSTFEKILK